MFFRMLPLKAAFRAETIIMHVHWNNFSHMSILSCLYDLKLSVFIWTFSFVLFLVIYQFLI